MKINNGIIFSNYTNNSHKNEINFKAKTIHLERLADNALKNASFAISSVALATIALASKALNKTVAETEATNEVTIQEIEPTEEQANKTIVTQPAQLSIFHMNDFHGQNSRMQRAYTAGEAFEKGELNKEDNVLDESIPTDRLKLCSGDMFLGSDPRRIAIVNEFLNSIGVIASALGNHECDSSLQDFAELTKDKNYRLVSTNLHPSKENTMTNVISDSFIIEINGNKYGIIGASPIDIIDHSANAEEIKELRPDDIDLTIREIQDDINSIRQYGVNKIILLSHLGIDFDKLIAQSVNGIDIILGGHTHTLFTEVKEGENLFYSPNEEPVLIVQSGRDGEFIGNPSVKFNKFGQITDIDYNLVKTDEFEEDKDMKARFDRMLGESVALGTIKVISETPDDIYANENPNCNFMLDCLRSELGADIALTNSASIRNRFSTGVLNSRNLEDISPFRDKIVIIEATEKEIVDAIKKQTKATLTSETHRPGILQVSGLKYEFDRKTGELLKLIYINKNNEEIQIDIKNPSDKIYKVALNEFCGTDIHSGIGLKHRVDSAIEKFEYDINFFISNWMKKQNKTIEIKTDGRIQGIN